MATCNKVVVRVNAGENQITKIITELKLPGLESLRLIGEPNDIQ